MAGKKNVTTEPRRQQILNLLEKAGTLNVNELAESIQVSLVTIRNDLDDLAKEGLLQRTFGGAAFSHRTRFNRSFRERITAKRGHRTPNPDDAQIKEAIMGAADETYFLVDSSKYSHDCLTGFARLRDVDLTIIDSHLSRSKAAILEAAGARFCLVDVAKANLDREAADPNAEQSPSRDKAKAL